MGAVAIENLSKSYGAVKVLHDITVDIPDGEFVALVGPSGCGKSTLLRMIAGLETISGGEISIAGRVVNNVPPKDRDIAMVFQTYALYPHMTVEENMGFSLRLANIPKTERRERVLKAAAILGLEPVLGRYPRQMSGGQRQRVAMGRAIVRNPEVFLFDEPLSNLDAKLRVKMRSEIKQTHVNLGATSIYVTHDQIEAMTMADRIVVMNGGVIEQVGTPLDLYDNPRNMFVAGFIGSPEMNFFKGSAGNGAVTLTDGTRFVLPTGPLDGDVVLGIRPEHFRLVDAGIPAMIELIEQTGSETHIVAMIGHHRVTLALRDRVRAKAGDVLQIGIYPDKAHLFDAETGLRCAVCDVSANGTV